MAVAVLAQPGFFPAHDPFIKRECLFASHSVIAWLYGRQSRLYLRTSGAIPYVFCPADAPVVDDQDDAEDEDDYEEEEFAVSDCRISYCSQSSDRVLLILACARCSQGDEEGDEPAEVPEGVEDYEEDGDEVRQPPKPFDILSLLLLPNKIAQEEQMDDLLFLGQAGPTVLPTPCTQ